MENDNGKSINALTDRTVGLLRRSLVGADRVIESHELDVICAFAAGYVRLESKGLGRDAVVSHLIIGLGHAIHNKAIVKLDFVVLSGVSSRGSALNVSRCSAELKAFVLILPVSIIPIDRQLVSFVSRKSGGAKIQIRKINGKLRNKNRRTVHVENIIPIVSCQLVVDVLRIRDPVVENLMPGKVVVIHPDAVNIRRAFVASESDIHWRALGEVVVRRILNRTGHDAVDVNIHQAIFVLFLHDEAQPDMFIFLELGADFRLFRLESRLLSRNLDSASTAHPICDNRVVIQNVSGAEFDLDCLASTAEVGLKRFVADAKSRIA